MNYNTFQIKNMMNIRDLGGHVTGDGRKTKCGNIIRSDVPYNLNVDEINSILGLGISNVIDFRTQAEIDRKPCIFANMDNVEYYNIPMYGGDKMPESEDLIAPGYFNMIEDKDTIYKIMKIIANSKGGVLYHCSAGKDRTGVISALLLSLVGVGSEEIATDYYVSWGNIKKLIDELMKKNPNFVMFENKKEYILDFLDMLENKYGSAKGYLLDIGLNEAEIDKISKKLL